MDSKNKQYVKKLPVVLTKNETKEFFSVIDNFRNQLLFKMIYFLGLRVGEVLNVGFEDINLKEGIIKIHSEKKRKGTIAERFVTIPKELKVALESYLKIVRIQKGKMFKLTPCRVWQLLKMYIKKTNITKERITVHTLRHSYATYLFTKTGNIELVRKVLGHENIDTTKIYTHLSTTDTNKLVNKAFDDW